MLDESGTPTNAGFTLSAGRVIQLAIMRAGPPGARTLSAIDARHARRRERCSEAGVSVMRRFRQHVDQEPNHHADQPQHDRADGEAATAEQTR